MKGQIPEAKALLRAITKKRLALRTFAVRANNYKADLVDRKLDSALVREYRLARFSKYIWVVEAIDRDLRKKGLDCVLGEAIFDATSSESEPNVLALHVPGVALVQPTSGPLRFPIKCSSMPYPSGGVGIP